MRIAWTACLAALLVAAPVAAQQVADPDFRPIVANPAYTGRGPVVLIDEAHANFHTASGRYAPFAALLRADGFEVRPSTAKFTPGALRAARILVVANASADPDHHSAAPAFTAEECAAVRAWVEAGGSLMLIADHMPFGSAAAPLAEAFGVRMGKGWTYEPAARGAPITTQLDYSRRDGRLADHPITRGRNAAEAVQVIRAFSGQSLTVPPGAANLMKLSEEAREAADADVLNAEAGRPAAARTSPRAGPSQGLAMTVGKGRVVVIGEAAMFSAQVATLQNPPRTVRMGMNVPGYDNQQFALNVVRWLAGAID